MKVEYLSLHKRSCMNGCNILLKFYASLVLIMTLSLRNSCSNYDLEFTAFFLSQQPMLHFVAQIAS